MFAGAPEGIVVLDDAGRILSANAAMAELLGVPPDELEQRSLMAVINPSLAQAVLAELRAQGQSQGTLELRHTDGRLRLAEYVGRARFHSGRHLLLLHDCTQREQLEARLRQAQKLEVLGRLVGGVAHDFNNLLTGILIYAGLAAGDLPRHSRLTHHLKEIQVAAEQGAALVSQLLAFGRQQPLQPKVTSIDELLRPIQEMLERLLGEAIELILILPPGLGKVQVDSGQLQQAVLNLALNARDAMPQGGRLTIETAELSVDPEMSRSFPGLLPGSYLQLTVSDNGPGMDEETRSRLFEPFFTTKEVGQGSGLGLASVYGTVKQSGGFIYAESQPGAGTTMRILLPRMDEAVAQEGEKGEPASAPPLVLLVEDEDLVRRSLEHALTGQGLRVLAAREGQEALRLFRRHQESIALLVSDIVMPGMGGRELARRLLELRPGLPVLFLTGYRQEQTEGPLSEGRVFYKPFNASTLREAIQSLLESGGPLLKPT